MKKRIFSYIAVTFLMVQSVLAQNTAAQQSRQPTGEVTYKQISLWDTEKTGVLLFNSNESVYYYGRTTDGSELNNKVKKDDYHYEIELGDKEGWTFYKTIKGNKIYSRDNIWTKYFIVNEELPQFNWKISSETKKIGNYTCQKAECSFRGRDYEAWFTTAVPINWGPWKFWGLPGLIVEVYDTNREFKFTLVSINIPAKSAVKIEAPKDGEQVSYEQFRSIYKKKMKALVNSYKIKSDPTATGTLTATVNDHSLEQL